MIREIVRREHIENKTEDYHVMKIPDNVNPFQFYCRYMNPTLFAQREYLDDVMKDIWEFIIQDEKELLMINLPQGGAKSYLATLLSTFLIGMINDISILRITNTQSNADDFTAQASTIINSMQYKLFFKDMPELANDNKTTIKLKGNWNYSLRGVGAETTTMGIRAKFFIVDDIYSSFTQALKSSETKKLTTKWDSDWYGRSEKTGHKVVVVGTRYAKNDFYEFLEKNLKLYKKITIPALDENNKSFCELIRTTESLLNIKERNDEDWFNALYQQEPTAEGQIELFKNMKLNTINTDDLKFEVIYSITDPSQGVGNDFFACGVFGVIKKTVYLIDLFYQRHLEYEDYYKFLKKYNTRYNYIENNGIGGSIIRDNYKQKTGIKLTPFTSVGDKYSRVYEQRYNIPTLVFDENNINKLAIRELEEYPNGDSDDFTDMLASATRILFYRHRIDNKMNINE